MMFNLGATRFAKFNNMWKGVIENDWEKGAVEMEDSRWFKQVGRRSVELQEIVKKCLTNFRKFRKIRLISGEIVSGVLSTIEEWKS